MTIINEQSGTNIEAITDGIYRINTPVDVPGGFSFNQYLIEDTQPLLFHTGPRKLFPLVREAVESIMPVHKLRYIGFCHVEADECGSLNEWLSAAPDAVPLCSQIAAMVSVNDMANRPAKALADGEMLSLGQREVQWVDTPHLPHGWEAGFLMELNSRTLFCGDLFTQGGMHSPALTVDDILDSSEQFRHGMDYFSHGREQAALLEKLALLKPDILACMHGSAWEGDGASLIRKLSKRLVG
jgi:flavorubredoxin